jgi:hypothetical protein
VFNVGQDFRQTAVDELLIIWLRLTRIHYTAERRARVGRLIMTLMLDIVIAIITARLDANNVVLDMPFSDEDEVWAACRSRIY